MDGCNARRVIQTAGLTQPPSNEVEMGGHKAAALRGFASVSHRGVDLFLVLLVPCLSPRPAAGRSSVSQPCGGVLMCQSNAAVYFILPCTRTSAEFEVGPTSGRLSSITTPGDAAAQPWCRFSTRHGLPCRAVFLEDLALSRRVMRMAEVYFDDVASSSPFLVCISTRDLARLIGRQTIVETIPGHLKKRNLLYIVGTRISSSESVAYLRI